MQLSFCVWSYAEFDRFGDQIPVIEFYRLNETASPFISLLGGALLLISSYWFVYCKYELFPIGPLHRIYYSLSLHFAIYWIMSFIANILVVCHLIANIYYFVAFCFWYKTWKEFSIKKPRLSGITKHGCTHTIFYIIRIETKSWFKYTGHSPGANIFPFDSSDQMLHAN